MAIGGIVLAWAIYGRGWERSQRIAGRITGTLGEVYHTVANKYYIDEMINATVIKGSMVLAKVLSLFDKHVVDGIVNAVGRTGKAWGFLSAWFDKTFVDGLVNAVALVTQGFGSAVASDPDRSRPTVRHLRSLRRLAGRRLDDPQLTPTPNRPTPWNRTRSS